MPHLRQLQRHVATRRSATAALGAETRAKRPAMCRKAADATFCISSQSDRVVRRQVIE
jgi:hypothetical protein